MQNTNILCSLLSDQIVINKNYDLVLYLLSLLGI